jgi:ATP-dependent DNA ligase
MTENTTAAPMLISEIPGHRGRILAERHVYVQPKLDGWCCMANTRTRKLYSRSGKEITTLPHINAALPVEGPEWLHGELYVHGAGVDKVQSMIKRGDERIEFHVFDCVSDEPFSVRIERVLELATNGNSIGGAIKTVPTVWSKPSQVGEFYRAALIHGWEGLIVRLDGHGYEHKRSINIFKMKPGTEVL